MKTIAPQVLHDLCQNGVCLRILDVRTPMEFSQVHIPGAELVPLQELDPAKLSASGWAKDVPVYLVCRSGGRATEAGKRLEQEGFSKCYVVDGGTMAWAGAGLPVNRGAAKGIPLERQVRIVIGTMVLGGVLLSQYVRPEFIWLSAVMGAGLIYSGLTDWCGIGLLMARLPWNRGRSCSL